MADIIKNFFKKKKTEAKFKVSAHAFIYFKYIIFFLN